MVGEAPLAGYLWLVGGRGRHDAGHAPPIAEPADALKLRPRYRARTVITGQVAWVTTRVATLPSSALASPVRPWVPITIISA